MYPLQSCLRCVFLPLTVTCFVCVCVCVCFFVCVCGALRSGLDQYQPRGSDLWWVLLGPPQPGQTHLHRQTPAAQRLAPRPSPGMEWTSHRPTLSQFLFIYLFIYLFIHFSYIFSWDDLKKVQWMFLFEIETIVIIIVSFYCCKLRGQKQYWLQISAQVNRYRSYRSSAKAEKKSVSVSALKKSISVDPLSGRHCLGTSVQLWGLLCI